jgi:hypothetical protein
MLAEIPLVTAVNNTRISKEVVGVLTGDVGRGLEFGCHCRVQGNHHLSLLSHLDVPLLDLFGDPFSELLTNNSGANIHNPLLRRLWQVNVIRQVVGNVRQVADEDYDLLDREILILRHVKVLDTVILQVGLLLVADVLQKIYRDIVCMERVIMRLWRQERTKSMLYLP